MITVDQTEREERRKFLNKAIKFFERDPDAKVCSVSGIEEGELIAIKNDNRHVIIFRIAAEDVELYPNVIKIEE